MEELKSIPILSQMTDEQHASYSARCSWRVYEAGEMILDHEETSNDVRFIAAGFVRIVARVAEGREVIFKISTPVASSENYRPSTMESALPMSQRLPVRGFASCPNLYLPNCAMKFHRLHGR